MKVTNLQEAGLYVPYDQMNPSVIAEAKFRLMDSILALIGGALSVSEEEYESLKAVVREESGIRPAWPLVSQTSLEMAGFLNGYFMRYADWGDTYRRLGVPANSGVKTVGGHPSDTIAAILALCDTPGVSGRKIIELIHLSYQMWAVLTERMLGAKMFLDYTTTLSLITPVVAAVCFGATPERVQNALNLSASSGAILEQCRMGDITNLKSAATGYAIARGFWWYRMSEAIQAPASMFDGKYGWYKSFAPMEGELVGPEGDEVYHSVETKKYPCCNANQSPMECAAMLYKQVKGKLNEIQSIMIRVSKEDAVIILVPDKEKYPSTQSIADHHIRYCVATGLQYGIMTPLHFKHEYLQAEMTRHLIDLMDVAVMTDEEAAAINAQPGACILEITMKDGSTMRATRSRPAGVVTGLEAAERQKLIREIVEKKREMIEAGSGLNLGSLTEMVYGLEEYDGRKLLDTLLSTLKGEKKGWLV